MSTVQTPYITGEAGGLITAEIWNNLQVKIKDDISKRIKEALDNFKIVAEAENAHKLNNKTAEELAKEIVQRAVEELPKHRGYRRYFKRLSLGKENVIEHRLGAFPLVDLYQLRPFEVVCSEDDERGKETVYFYLYYDNEKRIRYTDQSGATSHVEIEQAGANQFRVPFQKMLEALGLTYPESIRLGELETRFWNALFDKPNDQFDDDHYCHSPWFDRCCGEHRTVASLMGAEWERLYLKFIATKTINYTTSTPTASPRVTPPNVQVAQFDLDNIGLTYLPSPVVFVPPSEAGGSAAAEERASLISAENIASEIKVMTLLTV